MAIKGYKDDVVMCDEAGWWPDDDQLNDCPLTELYELKSKMKEVANKMAEKIDNKVWEAISGKGHDPIKGYTSKVIIYDEVWENEYDPIKELYKLKAKQKDVADGVDKKVWEVLSNKEVPDNKLIITSTPMGSPLFARMNGSS